MKLTKKQKLVLDFISAYSDEYGYAPTQEEIRLHFGLKSLGSVQDYIRYLTQAGYLRHDSNAVRGLEVVMLKNQSSVENAINTIEIPLFGKVAAGSPIEALYENESISIPANMIGRGEFYALKVEGQSMIEDGIFDGDYVIIKQKETAQNGETVVATINNEATIKKYFKKAQQIELHPANEKLRPIIMKEGQLEIKGILVGLIRTY